MLCQKKVKAISAKFLVKFKRINWIKHGKQDETGRNIKKKKETAKPKEIKEIKENE